MENCYASIAITGFRGKRSRRGKMAGEVERAYGAASGSVDAVVTSIVSKSFLESVEGYEARMRRWFYDNSFETGIRGLKLLPGARKNIFALSWAILVAERETAIEDLVYNYTAEIESRRQAMGGMFDENEYPSPEVVRAKFSHTVTYLPMPNPDHVSGDELKAQVEQARVMGMNEARRDAWERVLERAEDILASLQAYNPATGKGGPKNWDTKIGGLKETLIILEEMNIWDDPSLRSSIRILQLHVADVAPEILKHDETARLAAIQAAQTVATRGAKPDPEYQEPSQSPVPVPDSQPEPIPAPTPAPTPAENFNDLLD